MLHRPKHRNMFALDIEAFGTRHDPHLQIHLRNALYQITEEACAYAGFAWKDCYHEDRGDGLYAIAPADVSVEDLFDPLAHRLYAGVRQHNKMASEPARMRVRMAVQAGYVYFDNHGVTGSDLIHLFRLLDAPAFKNELASQALDFALLTSHRLFCDVLRYVSGIFDPISFQHLAIQSKETLTVGWLWLPPGTQATTPQLGLS